MKGRNDITSEQLATIKNPAASGVLVFCSSTKEFLLVQRKSKEDIYSGYWSIPSKVSRVNEFESLDDCGRRALLDETGLDAGSDRKSYKLLDRYVVPDQRVYFIYLFTVKKKPYIPPHSKYSGLNWFSPSNLPENTSPEVKDIIDRVHYLYTDEN